MGVASKIGSVFSSNSGSNNQLEAARDRILQGEDPRVVAEDLGFHITELAEELDQQGKIELEEAEEHENKVRNGIKQTEVELDKVGSREVEDPDVPTYETVLGQAEEKLEDAEESQEKISEVTEDAENYFKAVLKIGQINDTQVGTKKFKKQMQEAQSFEDRLESDFRRTKELRSLFKDSWKKLDNVTDSSISKQEQAVREVARDIHQVLNQN